MYNYEVTRDRSYKGIGKGGGIMIWNWNKGLEH